MRLRPYLKQRGETIDQFSERSGVSRATLYRVLKRGARSAEVIQQIVNACAGKVRYEDLINPKKAA